MTRIHYCKNINEHSIPSGCLYETIRKYDRILAYLIAGLSEQDLTALALAGGTCLTTTDHKNVIFLNNNPMHVLVHTSCQQYRTLVRRAQAL